MSAPDNHSDDRPTWAEVNWWLAAERARKTAVRLEQELAVAETRAETAERALAGMRPDGEQAPPQLTDEEARRAALRMIGIDPDPYHPHRATDHVASNDSTGYDWAPEPRSWWRRFLIWLGLADD
ncbi:hypothetical protein N8K70_03805 [Microbacterium betulae]|uniref:Uncharacterized protein n=1 Tax=Microbacterium betulae TaxID=2981139 RepID=A0AA97FIS9_9MICO|nr:hypothetical protein [Microbacterium sp. AB]WOF23815.1 hypothetical protein N8K70_03805 [Microbacterium sp. AB]